MSSRENSCLYGWHLQLGRVDYRRVLDWQRGLVRMRGQGLARDTIITVEHPPVITVGRDGHARNFSEAQCQPVFVERGGDVTYHGPGQLVVYFIFNLDRRHRDLHRFMGDVQDGVIAALADYEVAARKDSEHTGVWVGDRKIASVGLAVKRWISYHGAAVNLNTSSADFAGIRPCGLDPDVMTSVQAITGRPTDLQAFGSLLVQKYANTFKTTFTPVALEDLAEDVESQAGGYEI
ncbi:MAG TPA: lipoyl(octanoyl) transferase LipB [Acidobacteriota bacterium]|nr:lipoyl(octanoyl) transferase LipB [Acidobacteriota bacterium]